MEKIFFSMCWAAQRYAYLCVKTWDLNNRGDTPQDKYFKNLEQSVWKDGLSAGKETLVFKSTKLPFINSLCQ